MNFDKVCKIIGTALTIKELYTLSIQSGLIKVPEGKKEEEFISKMNFRTSFDLLESYLKHNFGLDLIEAGLADDVDGSVVVVGILYRTYKSVISKSRCNDRKEYNTIDQFFQAQKEKKITKRAKVDPNIVPTKVFSNEEKQEFLVKLLGMINVNPIFRKYYLMKGYFGFS